MTRLENILILQNLILKKNKLVVSEITSFVFLVFKFSVLNCKK